MYSENTHFDTPPSHQDKPRRLKRWYKKWWGKSIIIFLTIFFVLAIAMAFYVSKVSQLLRSGELTPADILANNSGGTLDLETLIDENDPTRGPRDAKVVIIEYGDFQCPFCKQAHPVVKEIIKDYGDKILFVWKDFPLLDIHPQALFAALAAQCANDQGKFWEMHDKIFENQQDLSETAFKTYAIQLGLDSIQFGECVISGKHLKSIEEDLLKGYEIGVKATPTFVINGILVAGAIPLDKFEQIIVAGLNN